jgi:hypothetical protein
VLDQELARRRNEARKAMEREEEIDRMKREQKATQ